MSNSVYCFHGRRKTAAPIVFVLSTKTDAFGFKSIALCHRPLGALDV